MSDRGPASWALCLYYCFLLLTTALSYRIPYPLFGALLLGQKANGAVVADCLILLHIVIGIWKAQALTWYLLLVYNGFELASLGVTLLRLGTDGIASAAGAEVSPQAVQTGIVIGAASMAVVTAYAAKLRRAFQNRSPFLF